MMDISGRKHTRKAAAVAATEVEKTPCQILRSLTSR
jgi:hypothetical protein